MPLTHADEKGENSGDVTGRDNLSSEALYRTRWLMAHNRLHAMVHGQDQDSGSLADSWNEYLRELETSEVVAQLPA